MIFGFTRGALRTKVAYNTLAQLISKFLSAGTTFAVSFFLARTYGPDSFGDFIKITTFVGLFFLATDFGLNAQWLKQKMPWRTLIATRLALALCFSVVALIALWLLPGGQTNGYTESVRMGIYIFLPAIFFQSLLTSANAVFQKSLRYDLSTLALAAGVVVVLSSLLVLPGLGVPGVITGVLAMLGGIVTTAFVSLLLAKNMSTAHSYRPVMPSESVELFVLSIPLGLTLVFNVIYGHVDGIILAATRSTAEVGFYGFAYRIFELALAIPTFFMNAVYPLLLAALGRPERFLTLTKKSLLGLIAGSVAVTGLLWLTAPLLSLIRPEFAASVPALRVLSLGLPIFFVSGFVMWALIALGNKRALVVVYGVGMLGNIALNLLLVPSYGYMAAAWITLVSEAAVLAATATLFARMVRHRNRL